MKKFDTLKETGFKAIENNIPELVKKIKEAEEAKCAATTPMIFIAVGIIVTVVLMVLFSSCGTKDTRSYVEREYPHMWDQRDAFDSSLNADVQAIDAKY